VPLDDQDRSRWDHERIAAAVARLDASGTGSRGPYRVQALIAAEHATAVSAAATDWSRIAALYAELAAVMPGPVVDLNRAVAVAMAGELDSGLAIVQSLIEANALPGYHLLFATRADFLRRLGRTADAAADYQIAISLTTNDADRRLLERARMAAREASEGA
jgi:RNA polymerase sigma-70 factor (ECF subfamily)